MKLNSIHQDLKELYKNNERIEDALDFSFSCENEIKRVINLFKKGYWSVMPFAFDSYDSFAIRLNPRFQVKDCSIVYFKREDGITLAANLKTFLPLINLKYLDDIEIIKEDFIGNRDEIMELSLPYREYTESLDCMDFFYEYILDEKNQVLIKNNGKHFKKVYLDFWRHYNASPEQKRYEDLVIKLVKNKDWYPDYCEVDYGIWNTRVYNLLAQRAYGDLEANFKDVEKHYWKTLIQPHGFDSVIQGFSIIPNPSSNSYLSLSSILGDFNPDLNRSFSKEILEHPLYEAVQELRVRLTGYKGERHIEAAAILDTEYNDPYASWDALVTASYWAGQAGSKAIEPIWEAAIYLSEKHNWTEIHDVLVQQYAFYNHYKDKL